MTGIITCKGCGVVLDANGKCEKNLYKCEKGSGWWLHGVLCPVCNSYMVTEPCIFFDREEVMERVKPSKLFWEEE